MREITPMDAVGRAFARRFRKPLWQPFVAACKRYGLTRAGDRIAAPLDGSGEAFCAAMLLRELQRHSEVPYTLLVCPAPGTDIPPETAARLGLETVPWADAIAACPVRAGTVCMSDVTEGLLAGMLREGCLHVPPPRREDPETGAVLIQPLYCAERAAVRAWCRSLGLPGPAGPSTPEAAEMRALIDSLLPGHPNAEISLFRAAHAVRAGTFPPQEAP